MIPISTDAPIYHYPIATVSMIVINAIAFVLFCANPEVGEHVLKAPDGRVFHDSDELEEELAKFQGDDEKIGNFMNSLKRISENPSWVELLSVQFGYVRPWQWVTNNFMHADWFHLIGNMIFLWAFGLVTEGKLGSILFLGIYLGIGTVYGMVLQLGSCLFGLDGIALGASAAIFGLLALCVAWAPANEFTIIFGRWMFEITVLMYGFLFVLKEVLGFALSGFSMSSELLHIIGFGVGLPIGLVMVKRGFVDCEGWDVFSYLAGKTGSDSKVGVEERKKRERAANAKANAKEEEKLRKANLLTNPEDTARMLYSQVEEAIAKSDFELAIQLQSRLSKANANISWRQHDLYRVIQGLLKQKKYDSALPMMEHHVEAFDEHRFAIQVLMIKVWLQQQRPRKALLYMQGLNLAFFSPEQTQQLNQLAIHAKKLIADGVIEIL